MGRPTRLPHPLYAADCFDNFPKVKNTCLLSDEGVDGRKFLDQFSNSVFSLSVFFFSDIFRNEKFFQIPSSKFTF